MKKNNKEYGTLKSYVSKPSKRKTGNVMGITDTNEANTSYYACWYIHVDESNQAWVGYPDKDNKGQRIKICKRDTKRILESVPNPQNKTIFVDFESVVIWADKSLEDPTQRAMLDAELEINWDTLF